MGAVLQAPVGHVHVDRSPVPLCSTTPHDPITPLGRVMDEEGTDENHATITHKYTEWHG